MKQQCIDEGRQQELLKYHVLDTEPEAAFDSLAHLASYICQAPVALVTFVDFEGKRIFFKSRHGFESVSQIPLGDREHAFCAQAILGDEVLVVPDALTHERFQCNPLVTSDPRIRFYAGAPLITPAGYHLGNLCVLDTKPRQLNEEQLQALRQLSQQVVSQLELRLGMATLAEKNRELAQVSQEKNHMLGVVSHDLRQPLANIMVCCELLLEGDDGDQSDDDDGDQSNDEAQEGVEHTTEIGSPASGRGCQELTRLGCKKSCSKFRHQLRKKQADLVQTSHSCAQMMHSLVDELLYLVEFDFGKMPLTLNCQLLDIVPMVNRIVMGNVLCARRKGISFRLFVQLLGANGEPDSPHALSFSSSPLVEVNSVSSSSSPTNNGGLASSVQLVDYLSWERRHSIRHKISCQVDPIKFEQALNNLITNAIKFSHPDSLIDIMVGTCMPKDEPTGSSTGGFFTTRPTTGTSGKESTHLLSNGNGLDRGKSNNRMAFVSVKDCGVGIPREEMSILCQPFKKLSTRPTGGESSTGLGLAIVSNILRAHGGAVEVESELGKGSTFRLLLPLPARPKPPFCPRSLSGSVGQAITMTTSSTSALLARDGSKEERDKPAQFLKTQNTVVKSLNILVVDDNVVNLKLTSQVLRRNGHVVWTAGDGQEALEVFERQGGHKFFDMIMVDEEMPRMRGIEVITCIRQLENDLGLRLRLPLISISGNAQREWRTKITRAGADEIFTKPFKVSKLLDIVDCLGKPYAEQKLLQQEAAVWGV